MRRGRGAAVLAAGALLLGAAGCSDGSDDAVSPTTTASSTATTEASAPVTAAELERFGRELVADTGSTGAIVAVSAGGVEPVVVAVGTEAAAGGQLGPPMDSDAPLHVASVTKSYVAALALVLEADGLVALDAPVSTWIDWPGGERITLRQLLTHTSGLGRFADGEEPSAFLDLVAAGKVVGLDEVLAAARSTPPVGEPGGDTRYANLNYIVAGAVLEAAGDAPLRDLLQRRVFGPAGLAGTDYPPGAPAGGTSTPVGRFEVVDDADPILTSQYPVDVWQSAMGPSSAATSTVADLLAWSDVVFRQRRLGDVDLAPLAEIGPGGVGLGVIGVGADGDCVFDGCPPGAAFDRWALNGDFPGASTRVLHDPERDLTLVVFLNRNALDLDAPLIAFLDTL
ncbi:MAG: beta-lactamase family protein [Actinobacteria bacterium]|nr:beta-lactamase family protein [Actinomycetota bacterium]